jgi:hypothetical protein
MKDDHEDDHKELPINLQAAIAKSARAAELTYQLPYPVNGSVRSLAHTLVSKTRRYTGSRMRALILPWT